MTKLRVKFGDYEVEVEGAAQDVQEVATSIGAGLKKGEKTPPTALLLAAALEAVRISP